MALTEGNSPLHFGSDIYFASMLAITMLTLFGLAAVLAVAAAILHWRKPDADSPT